MEIGTAEALGRAVAAIRIQYGLRQDQVALAAGTGLRFIHDLEAGKPTLQLGKVLRVLATLGLSLDLLDSSGNSFDGQAAAQRRRRVRKPSVSGHPNG